MYCTCRIIIIITTIYRNGPKKNKKKKKISSRVNAGEILTFCSEIKNETEFNVLIFCFLSPFFSFPDFAIQIFRPVNGGVFSQSGGCLGCCHRTEYSLSLNYI